MPTVIAFTIMPSTWCAMSSQADSQHSLGQVLPYPAACFVSASYMTNQGGQLTQATAPQAAFHFSSNLLHNCGLHASMASAVLCELRMCLLISKLRLRALAGGI